MVTLDVFPSLEGEELAAVVGGYCLECGPLLNGLVEDIEVLKQEDGVVLLVIDLHVREEHVECGIEGDLWVLALEGGYED